MTTNLQNSPLDFSNIQTARGLSYRVLCAGLDGTQFASRLLEDALGMGDVSGQDRRLATELTYGVVRRERTLDAIIETFVSRGRASVEPELWCLLRLGAYQLIFLTGVPTHAAVNETVALASSVGRARWTGFANGVLRSMTRALTGEPVNEPGRRAVPLRDGDYLGFDRDLFADPHEQPAEYFAAAFGFGDWAAQRWLERFGFERLLKMGFWFNAAALPCLRVNLLRVDREVLLEDLSAAGVSASEGTLPESVRLGESARITELPGFRQGWFTVQDESAMAAARLLNPAPGTQVWDMCAAPGGKTTHMAEIMQNQGTLLASDIEFRRIMNVEQTRDRLGLNMISTRTIYPDSRNLPDGPFDAILVDAPCSNSGVLGKRPEARHRVTAENVAELSELQARLLGAALDRLVPGGRLVYSTCSIEPEENHELVLSVLAGRSDVTLLEEQEHIPGEPVDGGYQALLQRT
ncbi:Ribosomal RNA small subunit methyltransferase B [Symmachiella dynata]|uniref:16S rRNA (cytosine(967)-C(5))-methyltransferase RsmB n=1 Tax=Symmachiella dynata TaxID=2527995 RepID=UPI00118C49C1|nr:16S rRNA (cytosine(967)-C(5))-methyltransferase RsmB [Symmachiella dynata]QDT48627.1 Ribosomal RNA small subunit methyltransferase B [Symmachiella dynata]